MWGFIGLEGNKPPYVRLGVNPRVGPRVLVSYVGVYWPGQPASPRSDPGSERKKKQQKNLNIPPNCKNCCVSNVFGLSSENQ